MLELAVTEKGPAPQHAPRRVPDLIDEVLASPGERLTGATRTEMESRFAQSFDHVRVHTDAGASDSARSVGAAAYTVGHHVVFGAGHYAPATEPGRRLLVHELTHVLQQRAGTSPDGQEPGPRTLGDSTDSLEHKAEVLSERPTGPVPAPISMIGSAPRGVVQRRLEMRDLPPGEGSGFARLPELIDRLNGISPSLTFFMDGQNLAYHPRDGAVPNEFDRRMMALIDQPAVIPLRLTNRHSLVGDQVHGFHSRILGDGFESGYVDIDDLLASTDLALEVAMVHFLTERASAARYVHRIGIDPPNPGALRPEFNRAHARGIDAEVEVVRDFFGDPSIQFVSAFGVGPGGGTFRTYRNNRRDVIRFRVRTSHGANEGLDVLSIDVLMADGTTVRTAEEYRAILHPPP